MHLISTLGKERHTDLCEFETSLVYRVSARKPGQHRKTLSQKPKKKKKDFKQTNKNPVTC